MMKRWKGWFAPIADVLLATAVALAAAGSAISGSSDVPAGGDTSIAGDRYVVAAVYLLAGLALAFRRRAPLGVLLAVVALLLLPVLVWGSSEGFGAFIALLVALYSAGAHCERRRALFAFGVFTGFWLVYEARDPLNHDLGDVLGKLARLPALRAGVARRWLRPRPQALSRGVEEAGPSARRPSRPSGSVYARVEERARIARELHDAVAHSITVMVMQAEAADEVFLVDPEAARLAIGRVGQAGREGLVEVRRLVDVLRRPDDEAERVPQPGLASLPELVRAVRETGLTVNLTIAGTPRGLPAGVDISAYRIVQEALTNAIKHADATAVDVTVSYGDGLELEVADNGRGPARGESDGHGLVGIRERVAIYGGTLQIGAGPSGGFRVRVSLPAGATA